MQQFDPSPSPAYVRSLLGLTLLASAILLALPWRDTTEALVSIWMRSDTFMHCFLVAPVALYMLYEKTLRQPLPPLAPAPVGLILFAASGLLWLAAQAVSVAVVSQIAMVGSLVSLVFSLLGARFVRYAAYPLAFLFLAVPFGEGLIPHLIDLTTEFVVAGLKAIGIPVYREENALMLPTGNWSVVTACSGIRYLLATITVGTVYAYLNISSGLKRGLFLVASVLVALVGNWMRALGIVLLGHYSGNKLAVGADHLIYGWVFFGFLVFFLIAVGEIFFAERAVSDASAGATGQPQAGGRSARDALARGVDSVSGNLAAGASTNTPSGTGTSARLALVVLAVAGIAAFEGFMGARLTPSAGVAGRLQGSLPMLADYRIEAVAKPEWQPDFRAAPLPTAYRMVRVDKPSKAIDLLIYVWSEQGPDLEALAATNDIAMDANKEWVMVGAAARPRAFIDGSDARYAASLIRGMGGVERRVGVLWYTPRGRVESPLMMKLADLRSRLRHGRAPAWAAVISASNAGDAIGDWAEVDAAVTYFAAAALAEGWPTFAAQTPDPTNLPERVDSEKADDAGRSAEVH